MNLKVKDRGSIIKILIPFWIIIIILSQIPFLAQQNLMVSEMDEVYNYTLKFSNDGRTGHYYIERYQTDQVARINLEYTTNSNTLEVDCDNIKVLKIFCRELYEDKSEEVLKYDPNLDSNYYKTYFITRNHFHVHVRTEQMIKQLSFIDTPVPYNVTVNNQEWWLTGINYTYNYDGIILTKVPVGHSYVDIYFQSSDKNKPVAKFTTDHVLVSVGDPVEFDASASFDPDGEIETYVWDFGDGIYQGEKVAVHSFTKEGKYNVILTVTDDDELIDRAVEEIHVLKKLMGISISVDKPIATPGSVLTYKISPKLNSTWTLGVKDIGILVYMPNWLSYVDSSPAPIIYNNSLSWQFSRVTITTELPEVILKTKIEKNVGNGTIIENYAILTYSGPLDQKFPQEISNIVTTKINIGSLLAPRIIQKVPDVWLIEDSLPYNLYLTPFEYDFIDSGINLRWHITEENSTLFLVAGEFSDDDIITITPLPNKYGNTLVNLWLTDYDGYTASQPLWINITPVNDKPVFSSAPDLIIHYEIPYIFDYEPYIFDIDTPMEKLQLLAFENITDVYSTRSTITKSEGVTRASSKTSNLIIDGFKVTYNYPKSFIKKQIFISLIIYDGENADGETIKINITEDFTPIILKNLPDINLYEGEIKLNVFDLDDYFNDPDKDSLFYTFGETHISITIHENHTVDISSPTDWYGFDKVTFRARDPAGAIAEDTIIVTVQPVNDAPMISGLPERFFIHYEADYSFDLRPYISDMDDPIERLSLILTDKHIRVDPKNRLEIIMNYPIEYVGKEIIVRIKVTDGLDFGFQDVIVKVTDNWPPELIKNLPDISFFEDLGLYNAFNLNDYFFDKDSKTLFYTFGQKFININIRPNGMVDFSSEENWFGVEIVTFRATDSTEAFKECVIVVSVLPVNDPPIIKRLPNITGYVNQLIKFDLSQYIIDIDNNITELSIIPESEKFDIVVSGRELIIYSNTPAIDNVTLKVNDGSAESTSNTIIKIIKKENTRSENSFIYIIWFLSLLIIIIIFVTIFSAIKRYNGKYTIEEIYWIYNNGSLILHQSADEITTTHKKRHLDEDILSGMLTAIIMFTQEVFSESEEEEKWSIKEIQMDNKNVMVIKGEDTYLAVIFNGKSGIRLYHQTSKMLQSIEKNYKSLLHSWDGDTSKFDNVLNLFRLRLIKDY